MADTERKKLPIGIESFRDIRTKGFYYVDKTGFIRELLNSWGSVNLFTRPRRFGKSLNMDMLKTFFETGTDPVLFKGLEIEKAKQLCGKYMGQYPVISLSLKDVGGMTYDAAIRRMSKVIKKEARRHQYLLSSDRLSDIDKESLGQLFVSCLEEDVQEGSIYLLSEMLCKHYGRKVIILIDEYDVPLDKAYQNRYYEEMVEHIRAMLSEALKTNWNLEFAVVTGCLRIAKESIFTGLNNFKVRTISDVDYAEYFGFTDEEVRNMLCYYGIEEKYDVIKEWYDGYRFGNVGVYCPWDVINQCDKFRVSREAPMEAHWENSSSNAIVQTLLENANATTRDQVEALISGECVEKILVPELTYTDLDNKDAEIRQTYLWTVLLATGYLTETETPKRGIRKLTIPNREIREIFERKILSWFKMKVMGNVLRWQQFCEAVRKGDGDSVEALFNEFMSDTISVRDTFVKKSMKENFYHGMLLGLLQAEGNWVVKSNAESGTGYADIQIEISSEKTGCVMEVKYAEEGKYSAACEEAMTQIDDNKYTEALRKAGMKTIYKYAVACYMKNCKVVVREQTVE